MHFYVVKSKTLKFILLMIVITLLLTVNIAGQGALAQVFFYKSNRKIPIYCVDRADKQISISFDAAWGSDKTQNILDILKEHDVPATFFLVGMWVDKNENLVKKMDEQGIEIGTHSNTHPDLTKISEKQIMLELETSCNKIKNITGKEIELFRAPFGAYNNTLLTQTESLGLKTIQWDVDSLDWKGIRANQICSNIFKRVKSGSIILCHNNSDYIVEALPTIITCLKQRGYKFCTIGNLIYKTDFSIDSTGKQIKI